MQKLFITMFCLFLLAGTTCGQKAPYDDPAVTDVNTEASRAAFRPYQNIESAIQGGCSQREISLNGDWTFKMILGKENIPADFYSAEYNASQWSQLPVPSNWQRYGHGFPAYSNATLDVEPDEVGLYRKSFTIAENWKKNGRVFIRFAGVKTAYHVYVNGKEVGYAEGAYLPSEFDLTDYLQEGENLLAVAVYRVADIQKIENFDTWRLSGIFREVTIQHRPDTYIRDIQINAPTINDYKDGDWSGEITIHNSGKKRQNNLMLNVQLLDKITHEVVVEEDVKVPVVTAHKEQKVSFSHHIKDIMPWSAETPNLYLSVIELKAGNQQLEATTINTGFRTIEVIDEQLCLNGRKIYMKGVNRHEWHPDMGRAITKEVMREDLEMMKRYHINSIRTCHYPNDDYLYELADEIGIYVMDEAAMETHWVTHAEKEEGFANAHLSRMVRMVERDKNYPSVILWSLGNEFYMGPHTDAMYEWAEKRDPSRLIYCDGDPKGDHLKIQPGAYSGPEGVKSGSKRHHKPIIMKEYMHAAGNEMGQFVALWETIRDPQYKNLTGGFIWDWKDQGWTMYDKKGTKYYDWGEDAGIAPTGNDGFDGIINTDMEENAKLLEVSKAFQDIKVKVKDLKKGRFTIMNRHSFRSLNEFDGRWSLMINGHTIATDNLPTMEVKAGEETTYNISPNMINKHYYPNDDVQLLFEFVDQKAQYDEEVVYAWDQIELQQGNQGMPALPVDGEVVLHKGDKSYEVIAGGNVYKYNTQIGRLISWRNHEVEMIDRTQGPVLNLWRATTDADNSNWGDLQSKYHYQWKRLGLDDPEFLEQKVKSVKLITEEKHKVVFDVTLDYCVARKSIAVAAYRYSFFPDGSMCIGVNFYPSEEMKKIKGLPRIGLTTHLKEQFHQVSWYGNGPHENYRDRASSAQVGEYQAEVSELYTSYIPAQANGNRCDVRWMRIEDHTTGVMVGRVVNNEAAFLPQSKKVGEQPSSFIEFTAIPYTEYELETTTHEKDLPLSDRVVLTIDSEHAGVASHPRPARLPEHEVKPEDKSFVFRFLPIRN
ncbi:hypothetical protein EYV94_05095 [Puteibacter caeruleilacunae]|nr:hypothetical protein EYV94_05095 [Puteibacter caeruleilacunae]